MTATNTINVATTDHTAIRPAGETKGRRLRRRHLWIIAGLAVAIVANQLGNENGVSILALIAFGVAPDLPRLLGLGRRRFDSLPVRVFNVLHHPASPVVAAVISAAGVELNVVPIIALVASLVWLGHVVIGLGVGDVPRRGGDRSHA
ncbi:MAG TPA: hypothetical protein VF253_11030 [Candidatus Limnocylindrales bacterium]